MVSVEQDYRSILRGEIANRCEKNPRYSLRAFARDIGVSSSRLSEVLNGRYGLSRIAAAKIGSSIGWNKQECDVFCDLVDSEHGRAKKVKAAAKMRLAQRSSPYQQLSLDSFQVISDWYHYAILELTLLDNFQSRPRWIAQKLGLSENLVVPAIERLKRLNLLTEKAGCLIATDAFTASTTDVPSDALKKFHRQLLEKAMSALQVQTVEERDYSHMILAIDRDHISEAKDVIKKFRRSFDTRFSGAPSKNQVYCLGLTFFRLQEK